MEDTTIDRLNYDVLLDIYDFYRLNDENAWNVRLGWCKLSQVCRRWRHLVHSSAFRLGMNIYCTIGTPVVDVLDHFPPWPLLVDYQNTTSSIDKKDEVGITHALQMRDRVRSIVLHLSPPILHESLALMNQPFVTLEHLSLSSTTEENTTLVLPKTFLAPNLRHLALRGVRLPKRLRLLTSTSLLVTLSLTHI